MFEIVYTPDAIDDLKLFKKNKQQSIVDHIDDQLLLKPTTETRNRKRLRPNNVAELELRIGKYRVFYDVMKDDKIVKIVAVGYKENNRLFIHGKEYVL